MFLKTNWKRMTTFNGAVLTTEVTPMSGRICSICGEAPHYMTKPTPKGNWVSCRCGTTYFWRRDKEAS